MRLIPITFIFLFLFSFAFVSSETWKYNYLDQGEDVQFGGNYSINVNNTNFFDGYSVATLWNLYETYVLALSKWDDYLLLAGGIMTGDIDMNENDILAINDLTADTIISNNLIGESNSTYGTYINSTDIVWGYIGGL